MVSTIIVFRHPMEMEEELQNVGKVNTTGLFIWTFLIIQKKVLSVTVIGENSLVTMSFFRRVAEKSCSYTMCKQRLK